MDWCTVFWKREKKTLALFISSLILEKHGGEGDTRDTPQALYSTCSSSTQTENTDHAYLQETRLFQKSPFQFVIDFR